MKPVALSLTEFYAAIDDAFRVIVTVCPDCKQPAIFSNPATVHECASIVGMKERALIVADQLLGTCKSLSDFATEIEQNNDDFCRVLDDNVMCCEQCNWWCDAGDVNDDGICNDCKD